MRTILASLTLTLACAVLAAPAHARQVTVYEWEEVVWEAADGEWAEDASQGSDRFVSGVVLEDVAGVATYGPFRVIDDKRAALVGITDHRSPREFAAMIANHPGLATLELVECPGTFDDIANLELGRMIRRAGMATHVPEKGSVRSGAVELFLAGATRSIADGARFAVHAWEDESGMQATDYAPNAPENRRYLSYYREMGMDAAQAQSFYAMTNSVSFHDARWLSAEEMRGWTQAGDVVPAMQAEPPPLPGLALEPRLAYVGINLDLAVALY